MADLFYVALVLTLPFMFGIVVGVGIVNARPKSVEHRFGELMKSKIGGVINQRRWIGAGSGFIVSETMGLDLHDGRMVEIIVRERT